MSVLSVAGFILWVNYAILVYFLLINGFYLFLYLMSFVKISDYARREAFSGLSELMVSQYAPPVSLIVPAYNEEATIAASVRSFLALHYSSFEVVIVNDGSTDRTIEILREQFGLTESDQPVRKQLQTRPIKAVYAAASESLIVVDKENGGKADALNVGICAANYPIVCCIDADVILEEDALLRIARPMIESADVSAVGGIVRVANGCEVDSGRVVEVGTPRSAIPNFQIVEYLRAFLAGRTGWGVLNALLIISGAFGMFRRRDLIAAGGYVHDTVGEDMELVTRLHRVLREENRRYRIEFIPDPVAWTEVPATVKVLRRQRDRWHRGLIDTLVRHRRMFMNPRYGTVGMLAMPYFLFFEFLGPVIELTGYAAFALGLALGYLSFAFAAAFFLVAVGLGIVLSVGAIFMEELRLKRYPHWKDLAKLTFYGVIENFGYRQLVTVWRFLAIISFLRNNQSWGSMERRGFDPAKRSKKKG
ncbi:glycosyltransferase family 2 protein [Rubrobacter aplysinae]|uniref:glycosyltransferase family 2 protein n=1 Tax=Rubrobacter aplysinae TaxID=909625 RepID=UPI000B10AADE|nr:glycosyltransferase [Rubrobacter aplysinae]